jgi:hypothetical protein
MPQSSQGRRSCDGATHTAVEMRLRTACKPACWSLLRGSNPYQPERFPEQDEWREDDLGYADAIKAAGFVLAFRHGATMD